MRSHFKSDLSLKLPEHRLITAEIIYCLPDYPELLQTFIWQNLDLCPDFPRLKAFLTFWQHNIEGRLFSVTVAHARDASLSEAQFAQEEFILH